MKAYLNMEASALSGFALQLQKGVDIWFQSGCSVTELVCDQLGVPKDYLDNRVQTIFVNGKVVDKPESSTLHAGDILTLSAAMPGLAGTTLRRGGHLGAFRGGITHDETKTDDPSEWAKLTIKVFNLLIKDLSPVILGRGVVIDKAQASSLFNGRPASFWELCREAKLDGKALSPQEFGALGWLAQGRETDLVVEFVS
jgi:hypothetical protein